MLGRALRARVVVDIMANEVVIRPSSTPVADSGVYDPTGRAADRWLRPILLILPTNGRDPGTRRNDPVMGGVGRVGFFNGIRRSCGQASRAFGAASVSGKVSANGRDAAPSISIFRLGARPDRCMSARQWARPASCAEARVGSPRLRRRCGIGYG